ncbi:Asp23/Gls24 family envelope stress response protein [Actinomadura macra]|uniref:Asp23/Gls24 family envelope stress response protein n=1 Tax=Actinomadura macra TaxID=46164 RepID=UPI00082B4FFA|nr:Asp23/Gls24 family envelope stress response protein [Actinomadura macra]
MSEERKSTGVGAAVAASGGDSGGGLVTSGGKTHIADGVVAKIASRAASDVGGVHAMGDGGALGNVRERLPGSSANRGVSVQVGERQAAVDLDLVVDYGVSIPELANAVRDNVIGEVEHMCGLEVVEVNIDVEDIYVEGENERESDSDQPRVR